HAVRNRVPRLLASGVALATAALGVGLWLGATPASALNHNTFNILRNAGRHQYCFDIRTEDAPVGARAHLWTCTHPVVGEQELKLVSDGFAGDHIEVMRSSYCLQGGGDGETVVQEPCDYTSTLQSWRLRDTGEIVDYQTGLCMQAADAKNAPV